MRRPHRGVEFLELSRFLRERNEFEAHPIGLELCNAHALKPKPATAKQQKSQADMYAPSKMMVRHQYEEQQKT